MSDASTPILNLDVARAAEAERCEALRPFAVVLTTYGIGLIPPGANPDMAPASEILDAADLVSDPGRLGEIARAMMARARAGIDEGAVHGG